MGMNAEEEDKMFEDMRNIAPTSAEVDEVEYVGYKCLRDSGDSPDRLRAFYRHKTDRFERAYQDELAARRTLQ